MESSWIFFGSSNGISPSSQFLYISRDNLKVAMSAFLPRDLLLDIESYTHFAINRNGKEVAEIIILREYGV